jgi:pimeloyl-ACP methyl ester carboxylesterase
MKRNTCKTVFGLCIAMAVASVTFGGCFLQKSKKDLTVYHVQWRLHGIVNVDSEKPGKLLAVMYGSEQSGFEVAAFRVVPWQAKQFVLFVPPGDYRFGLIHDLNGNLNVDPGEPVILDEDLDFTGIGETLVRTYDVPARGRLPDGYPTEYEEAARAMGADFALANGMVADLSDERFSDEAGKLGLWEPLKFLKAYGGGVYFFEPYDPDRIPILFVSGAAGSAQNWAYFYEHLDKTKYQFWYYLYPSGVRLERASRFLANTMRDIRTIYGVDKIYVLAHSMGGLVSRDFVMRTIKDPSDHCVEKYITIATPWNGHALAEKGVEHLSKPVPSWNDMIPGSEYIQNVFAESLKPAVDYYLVFGYLANTGGDGTIALTSQLALPAQEDAVAMRGFNAGHVPILSTPEVFSFIEKILDDTETEKVKEIQNKGAR